MTEQDAIRLLTLLEKPVSERTAAEEHEISRLRALERQQQQQRPHRDEGGQQQQQQQQDPQRDYASPPMRIRATDDLPE